MCIKRTCHLVPCLGSIIICAMRCVKQAVKRCTQQHPWSRVTSGFCRGVNEGSSWHGSSSLSFGTTFQFHPQNSLKMEPIVCPETSVTNYQSTLRKIPDVRRCHPCWHYSYTIVQGVSFIVPLWKVAATGRSKTAMQDATFSVMVSARCACSQVGLHLRSWPNWTTEAAPTTRSRICRCTNVKGGVGRSRTARQLPSGKRPACLSVGVV